MAWNISNILVNESIAVKKAGGGGAADLSERVTALETTVGDESSGLVKAVDDLEESEVSDLDDLSDVEITEPTNGQFLKYDGTKWINGTGGSGGTSYTLTDVPEKELTGTSYEDMSDVVLNPGVYHIIASAMNAVASVMVTGIRFVEGSVTLVESTVNGNVKSADMIYSVASQTTVKVQVKGSANCKNVKTWVMVAKVGDITPPAENTRKGGRK